MLITQLFSASVTYCERSVTTSHRHHRYWNLHLFSSLAVLDPRVGHTMDVHFHLSLSSVILIDSSRRSPVHVLMCPSRPCVVFLYCVHLALVLVWPQYASFLALTVSNSSLFTPVLLRTHSFVFFAVHDSRRIFLSPFISNASKCFFILSQCPAFTAVYAVTGRTRAFISRVFVKIGMLWLFHIFPIACPLFNLVRNLHHVYTISSL